MRHIRLAVTLLIAFALFAVVADAQRKPIRKAPVKKAPVTVVPPLDVRAAREKVDIQLADINIFIDKLGATAQNLETADADAKAGRLSAATAKKIEGYKASFVESIRNIKAGLSTLESEFRTKTTLQKHLPTIQGITDLAAKSEDSAIAGKFTLAKDPLREITKKLTDTLAVLPK
jgi:hypothetical protein